MEGTEVFEIGLIWAKRQDKIDPVFHKKKTSIISEKSLVGQLQEAPAKSRITVWTMRFLRRIEKEAALKATDYLNLAVCLINRT